MEGVLGELTYGVLLASGDDEVLGRVVLEHEPHALDIVTGIAPVAQGTEVPEVELVLLTSGDASSSQSDLTGDEGLATALTLVVEEDAVDGKHTIALAVVLRDPEAVELSYPIGGSGVEGRCLTLGDLLHQTEELGGRGLIDLRLLLQPEDADSLEETQRTRGIGLSGVLRYIEGDLHMALSCEVIDLVGLGLLDDADE